MEVKRRDNDSEYKSESAIKFAMNNYFQLKFDVDIPEAWYLSKILSHNRRIPDVEFVSGSLFDTTKYGQIFVQPNVRGNPVDYRHTTWNVPIISSSLGDHISHLDEQAIQRIPVIIFPDYEGHEIMNVLKVRNCVDFDRTETLRYDHLDSAELKGKIKMLWNIAIDPNKVKGDHIFRLMEYKTAIIVSEELRIIMETQGFTGLEFVPVT